LFKRWFAGDGLALSFTAGLLSEMVTPHLYMLHSEASSSHRDRDRIHCCYHTPKSFLYPVYILESFSLGVNLQPIVAATTCWVLLDTLGSILTKNVLMECHLPSLLQLVLTLRSIYTYFQSIECTLWASSPFLLVQSIKRRTQNL